MPFTKANSARNNRRYSNISRYAPAHLSPNFIHHTSRVTTFAFCLTRKRFRRFCCNRINNRVPRKDPVFREFFLELFLLIIVTGIPLFYYFLVGAAHFATGHMPSKPSVICLIFVLANLLNLIVACRI